MLLHTARIRRAVARERVELVGFIQKKKKRAAMLSTPHISFTFAFLRFALTLEHGRALLAKHGALFLELVIEKVRTVLQHIFRLVPAVIGVQVRQQLRIFICIRKREIAFNRHIIRVGRRLVQLTR